MTQARLPDPMVEVNKRLISTELVYTYLAPDVGLDDGTELVTTEQMIEYADARVKEALEEVADMIKSRAIITDGSAAFFERKVSKTIADEIRQLKLTD